MAPQRWGVDSLTSHRCMWGVLNRSIQGPDRRAHRLGTRNEGTAWTEVNRPDRWRSRAKCVGNVGLGEHPSEPAPVGGRENFLHRNRAIDHGSEGGARIFRARSRDRHHGELGYHPIAHQDPEDTTGCGRAREGEDPDASLSARVVTRAGVIGGVVPRARDYRTLVGQETAVEGPRNSVSNPHRGREVPGPARNRGQNGRSGS